MATNVAAQPTTEPRVRVMDRDLAMTLAATEYQRISAQLESLTDEQWLRPTDCPGWNVRTIAGHNLGMARMIMTVPELARQQLAAQKGAKKTGAPMVDVLTALQVARNADLSTADVIARMREVGPRAARRRRRMPAFIRGRTMPGTQGVGDGQERWTFGFLFDIILTRDPFMHRIDISQATGQPMHATAEHEGVIIDDVVREWAVRHGRPYALNLTGPAGGSWRRGESEGGEGGQITIDAFEFCRAVSGRAPATGLLRQQVPF